jgi:hypothetical protein
MLPMPVGVPPLDGALHPAKAGTPTPAAEGQPIPKALFLLGFAEERRFGQGENHDLFSGRGADVMMQAQHLDASDLLDHGFHDRPGRFDEMPPYLFDQVPPFLGRERLDQVLFGRRQNALEADNEEIGNQVSVNVLGSPTHVFLLKATDPFANGAFDFSLGFHGNVARSVILFGASPTSRSQPGVWEREVGVVTKDGSSVGLTLSLPK